jgi:hypothetical protein
MVATIKGVEVGSVVTHKEQGVNYIGGQVFFVGVPYGDKHLKLQLNPFLMHPGQVELGEAGDLLEHLGEWCAAHCGESARDDRGLCWGCQTLARL